MNLPSNNPAKKLPSYDRAPVVEVVAAVQFSDIASLKAAHISKLWEIFGGLKSYPKNEEQPPLPKAIPTLGGVTFVTSVGGASLNRQWFVSEDESALIQLQKDRLVCNWRKIKDKPYPRYDNVINTFYDTHEKLLHFVQQEGWPIPRVEQLELGYINIIRNSQINEELKQG